MNETPIRLKTSPQILPLLRWLFVAVLVWSLLHTFGSYPYNWWIAPAMGWKPIVWGDAKALVMGAISLAFLGWWIWLLWLFERKREQQEDHSLPTEPPPEEGA